MTHKRPLYLTIGLLFLLSFSACSVFRKGCKCPTVHRYNVTLPNE